MVQTALLSTPPGTGRARPRTMGELMAFAQSADALDTLVEAFSAMIAELGFDAHLCLEIDDQGCPAPLFGTAARLPDWPGTRRPGRHNDLALSVEGWHGRQTWLCLEGRDIVLDAATRARIQGWAEVYTSFATVLLERERDIPTGVGLGLVQRQCLAQLLLGRREHEIADMLGLTPLTIRGHVESAMAFLGVRSRAEAVSLAARRGWLAGLEWQLSGVYNARPDIRG